MNPDGGLDDASAITNTDMGPKMYCSALGIPRLLEVIAPSGGVCRHPEFDQHPALHLYVIAQKRNG